MRKKDNTNSQNNYFSVRTPSTTRGKEALELKNIMSSIKFLQKRVN